MVNVRERGVNNEIMVEYCKEYFLIYKKTNADFRFKPENQRFIISRDDWIRTSDNTPPRRVL